MMYTGLINQYRKYKPLAESTEAITLNEGNTPLIRAKNLEAYHLLASKEGIFAEPVSCISVAGLLKAYSENKIAKGSQVVCILTGNGLKDPDIAISSI